MIKFLKFYFDFLFFYKILCRYLLTFYSSDAILNFKGCLVLTLLPGLYRTVLHEDRME